MILLLLLNMLNTSSATSNSGSQELMLMLIEQLAGEQILLDNSGSSEHLSATRLSHAARSGARAADAGRGRAAARRACHHCCWVEHALARRLLCATLLLRVVHVVYVLVGFDEVHGELAKWRVSWVAELNECAQVRRVVARCCRVHGSTAAARVCC